MTEPTSKNLPTIKWINPKEQSPLDYDGFMILFLKAEYAKLMNISFVGLGYIRTLGKTNKYIMFSASRNQDKEISIENIYGWIPYPEDYTP